MAAVAAVAAVVVAQVVAELVEFGADLVDAGGRRGVLRRRGLVRRDRRLHGGGGWRVSCESRKTVPTYFSADQWSSQVSSTRRYTASVT
ncbi:hypothetical protein ACN6LL_000214, partial [Streptomyces violaceoruber]